MQRILQILEQDARTDPDRIADMTGIDADIVRLQISQWEREGVIRGYRTVVDWQQFGNEKVEAFIDVAVTPERGTGFDSIAERIYRYPEVKTVLLVSGGHDLRVIVEGTDIRDIAEFVAQKLASLEGVKSTNTHFLLKRYKQDGVHFTEPDPDNRLMVAP